MTHTRRGFTFFRSYHLNLESVTHGTVYRSILKEASKERTKSDNSSKLLENDCGAKTHKRNMSAPDDSPVVTKNQENYVRRTQIQ